MNESNGNYLRKRIRMRSQFCGSFLFLNIESKIKLRRSESEISTGDGLIKTCKLNDSSLCQ